MSTPFTMDAPRAKRRTPLPLIRYGAPALAVLLVSGGVYARRTVGPTIERQSLWIEPVAMGDVQHTVRGSGTLRATRERIIASTSAGRVEALPVRLGATVSANTVIAELVSTDVELQALQSSQQLTAARSALASIRTSLAQQQIQQEAVVLQMRTTLREADRNRVALDSLNARAMAPKNDVESAHDRADEARAKLRLEERRLAEISRTDGEQSQLLEAQIARLEAIANAQALRATQLHVTAADSGVLQALPIVLGQWVVPGTELARVAGGGAQRAMITIAEMQAGDIMPGQQAKIDTRQGIVAGRVLRIDPVARNGLVTVELMLDSAPPASARAESSIEAEIAIATLRGVTSVVRPASASPQSRGSLFRITADGLHAERVAVEYGRTAGGRIEVLRGLRSGDRVIAADMSAFDGVQTLRLR